MPYTHRDHELLADMFIDHFGHNIPTVKQVCPTCRGNGTHVDPAIDGNGISADVFQEDPSFEEHYRMGHYNVICHECNGLRVVDGYDNDRMLDPEVEFIFDYWLEVSQDAAVRRAESGYTY